MNFEYHHMGIPVTTEQPGERYSPLMKMYTSGGDKPFRIQKHRFEEDSPLHPLIQNNVHVAFKVACIEDAIEGYRVLLAPYFPIPGFKVAIIEHQGAIIELIETHLSEEEIWGEEILEKSVLYQNS